MSQIDQTTSVQPADNIEDTDSADIKSCLSYFIASLFGTVLEDTITELRILAECNNELRMHKTWSDMGLLLALKFGVELPPVTDELAGIDPHNLGCMEYKLNKLDADRKFATGAMIDTYKDLTVNRAYTPMVQQVCRILNLDDHREFLLVDEAKHRVIRRDLNRQVRQQRNHIKTVIYDTNATIDELKTDVEDSLLYSECRSRYVTNWQRARTEQHDQSIKVAETSPSEAVEHYKQRADHEQRVHCEVELLTNIAINETLQKIEEWMNKYDKDLEGFDLMIQIKKNDYQNMHDKRVDLENTIEKHDILMKDWVHFKEEREKARQYRDKMTKSAICVQAWWRGMLVRRQLGPYKVAKKKPPKKK